MTVAVVLAALAAVLFGAGTAMQAQASSPLRPRRVLHVGSLATVAAHPLWLAGTALDCLGALTHIAALHFGPLSLVQPLSLSAIAFAVPAEALLLRRRPSRGQVTAALQTAAGLALVAVCLGRGLRTSIPTFLSSTVGVVLAVLAIGIPLLTATRCGSHRRQALLLGASAGACYGVSDALIRLVQAPTAGHAWDTPWFLVMATAVLVGGTGLVLTQAALQKGRLSSSLPAQDFLALTVSVGMGAALLGEVPGLSGDVLVVMASALCLMVLGTVGLSRPMVVVPHSERTALTTAA